MKLIAQKPCSFGGKKFYIGDEIPAGLVVDADAQAQMGVLAIFNHEETEPGKISILIHAEDVAKRFNLTPEGLQAIFDVLTGKPSEAEPVINQMTDGEALILLHMSESRRVVKAAAEARGKALEEAGEP